MGRIIQKELRRHDGSASQSAPEHSHRLWGVLLPTGSEKIVQQHPAPTETAENPPLAAKPKDGSVGIFFAENIVPDDFGGDQTEGDAVAAVAQRKVRVGKA